MLYVWRLCLFLTTDLYVAVSVISLLMRAALSLSVSLPAVCQSSINTPWGDIAAQARRSAERLTLHRSSGTASSNGCL